MPSPRLTPFMIYKVVAMESRQKGYLQLKANIESDHATSIKCLKPLHNNY